ncbi:phosphoadenosine phosphosulfate reductase family protein [Turicimonas muris]|uniref:phosphoadenosine phosphosulfate reductase domain-containing protein n=1 Tax=Turicimonas muris TaxID=1796652 RepID=UPI0023F3DFDD|nr:phosphoadenosine phosphosulfate reductase family protein [Turicimonas muris]
MEEIFQRHKEVVLFYSGGKDSLALLLLLRPYWDRVNVVWVDTGNQFPEVIEHMEKVKALVPHFTVLKGNTPKYLLENGFPVDVVPTRFTSLGSYVFGPAPLRVCSRFDCCEANIWTPMRMYVESTKPTCILRGDRRSERAKGLSREAGIEFEFPIWDWTDEQIWGFLRREGRELLQDRHFMRHGTSLDCQTCMAYSEEIPERQEYLKNHHPELYELNKRFFKDYREAVYSELKKIKVE